MYSEKITPQINKIFENLRVELQKTIDLTDISDVLVNKTSQKVGNEITLRSKTILSDMLLDLEDSVFQDVFFSDITRQNKFMAINLRKEIIDKYEFTLSNSIDYKEASRIVRASLVGAGVLSVGGVGSLLISNLYAVPFDPVSISVIIVAAFGVALADYFLIAPRMNKQHFKKAVDKFLSETQQQFLNWFNEIEQYFIQRVNQIKKEI